MFNNTIPGFLPATNTLSTLTDDVQQPAPSNMPSPTEQSFAYSVPLTGLIHNQTSRLNSIRPNFYAPGALSDIANIRAAAGGSAIWMDHFIRYRAEICEDYVTIKEPTKIKDAMDNGESFTLFSASYRVPRFDKKNNKELFEICRKYNIPIDNPPALQKD